MSISGAPPGRQSWIFGRPFIINYIPSILANGKPVLNWIFNSPKTEHTTAMAKEKKMGLVNEAENLAVVHSVRDVFLDVLEDPDIEPTAAEPESQHKNKRQETHSSQESEKPTAHAASLPCETRGGSSEASRCASNATRPS